jgi:hypothetical protein
MLANPLDYIYCIYVGHNCNLYQTLIGLDAYINTGTPWHFPCEASPQYLSTWYQPKTLAPPDPLLAAAAAKGQP